VREYAGLPVLLAGIPATWPVERVQGVVVSDQWSADLTSQLYGFRALVEQQGQLVFPADLAARLAPLTIPTELPGLLAQGDRLSEAEKESLRRKAVPSRADPWSYLLFPLRAQEALEAAFLTLASESSPALAVVHLNALDRFLRVSHLEPRLEEFARPLLRQVDQFVGRCIERLHPDVVLVVSSHGFDRARGRDGLESTAAGFALYSAPFLEEGPWIVARVEDLHATLLACLGLPVPRNTAGEVLTELLPGTLPGRFNGPVISSYDVFLGDPLRESVHASAR